MFGLCVKFMLVHVSSFPLEPQAKMLKDVECLFPSPAELQPALLIVEKQSQTSVLINYFKNAALLIFNLDFFKNKIFMDCYRARENGSKESLGMQKTQGFFISYSQKINVQVVFQGFVSLPGEECLEVDPWQQWYFYKIIIFWDARPCFSIAYRRNMGWG